jgi:hypothetical protein
MTWNTEENELISDEDINNIRDTVYSAVKYGRL